MHLHRLQASRWRVIVIFGGGAVFSACIAAQALRVPLSEVPFAGVSMENATSVFRRVFIARHGERIDHVDRTWGERATYPQDPPLTDRGRRQARELGVFLRSAGNIRTILSSPFARTLETAHVVAEELELPLYVEHGASEWLHAEWFGERAPELTPLAEWKAQLPRLDLESHRSLIVAEFPEDIHQITLRCRKAIQLITERYKEGDILVVGHGISVELMTKGLCGKHTKVNWVGYCAVCECVLDARIADTGASRDADEERTSDVWRLARNADASFLSEPEDPQHIHYI